MPQIFYTKGTIMRLLIWISCSMTLLFSNSIPSKQFSEKLIVYYTKNEAQAKEELLT